VRREGPNVKPEKKRLISQARARQNICAVVADLVRGFESFLQLGFGIF
jgi:hypothetical protein